MKKIKIRKLYLPLIIVAVAALFFAFIAYGQILAADDYLSTDLKITLSYPGEWYIQEKDYSILISSYRTRIGENSRPSNDQAKIFIDNFNNGCHPTIEENLKDPGCGEGGPNIKPNEIFSKKVNQTPDGVFYKYITETPNGQRNTYYLLEKGDRILKISKEPDPSDYEKEFEEIINSIKFMD